MKREEGKELGEEQHTVGGEHSDRRGELTRVCSTPRYHSKEIINAYGSGRQVKVREGETKEAGLRKREVDSVVGFSLETTCKKSAEKGGRNSGGEDLSMKEEKGKGREDGGNELLFFDHHCTQKEPYVNEKMLRQEESETY